MTSNQETNRDKVLRREVVKVSDGRLSEMQAQAISCEGVGEYEYHWHWAAIVNELIARRADETTRGPFEHTAILADPNTQRINIAFQEKKDYEAALVFFGMGDSPVEPSPALCPSGHPAESIDLDVHKCDTCGWVGYVKATEKPDGD